MNIRATAAQVIFHVVDKGQSLSTALPLAQLKVAPKDQALLQEICYGVLRFLPRLESITQALMEKPLTGKQRVLHHLILVGLYQLSAMRIPAHAAVAETVNATKDLRKPQLRGLINAVLRGYQREQANLDAKALSHDAGKYAHPSWLLKLLKEAYPQKWQSIVNANNERAPMWLRVNQRHYQTLDYLELLKKVGIEGALLAEAPNAIKLQAPASIDRFPEFSDGAVSVQDAAAQLAINYLAPEKNELILDCCAAPGGKTCHILEREPNAKVVAMDLDPERLKRVKDNLARLKIDAQVICEDARYPEKSWQGDKFDRILLDAPCSATGVIRRHPDIKWLRRKEDIDQLVALQAEILDAMWQQLKIGGTLVYATCSITPQENQQQIKAFLARTKNARLQTGTQESPGRQILPGEQDMDGFYYAVLTKQK